MGSRRQDGLRRGKTARADDPAPSRSESEVLSLSAILMLERHPAEVAFVWSLIHDVMRLGLWLWHEDDFPHAMHLLSFARFRLIMLDATFAPRLTPGALIRQVRAAAPATPVILRISSEDLPAYPDPRIYGVTAAVPKGLGRPTEQALRRILGL